MGSKVVTTFLAFFAFLLIGFSADKPDYSGEWVLGKDRSFSNPTGFDQQKTVTQKGELLKLAGKHGTARVETGINGSYTLDGKEADFVPTAGPPGGKGKRKSFRRGDGSFVVNGTDRVSFTTIDSTGDS